MAVLDECGGAADEQVPNHFFIVSRAKATGAIVKVTTIGERLPIACSVIGAMAFIPVIDVFIRSLRIKRPLGAIRVKVEVVINDVLDDRDTALVAFPDEMLVLVAVTSGGLYDEMM